MVNTNLSDLIGAKKYETAEFKEITPQNGTTLSEAKDFWNKKFDNMKSEALEENVQKYINDVREKSEFKDTIPEKSFDVSDLRKTPIEEIAVMHEEFAKTKSSLIQQWEAKHGYAWPTYKEDVYITSKNGDKVLIRKAGMNYDAHHLHPLSSGGKNEVSNITPLRADLHFDHRGVHALNSPYDNLIKTIGGINR